MFWITVEHSMWLSVIQEERHVLAAMLDVVTRRDRLMSQLNNIKQQQTEREKQQLNELYPTVQAFFTVLW